MLVDNEIDIRQSLWITLEAASKADRGEPFRKEAAMAMADQGADVLLERLGVERPDRVTHALSRA